MSCRKCRERITRALWQAIPAFRGIAVSLAAIVITSGASVGASAQSAKERELPAPVEGRWEDKARGLVLDISRCGPRFCGQQVIDGKCQRTVLRMDQQPLGDRPWLMALSGQLELPGEPTVNGASITVSGQGDLLNLSITGAVGALAPMTRTMLSRLELSRIGPPTCPAGATS